jgi:hypothetical protein
LPPTPAPSTPQEAKVAQRTRNIRRIGYALFGGIALWLCSALVVSVLASLDSGQIYDPFTGHHHAHDADLCQQWATSLNAAPADPTNHLWNMQTESWLRRCAYLGDANAKPLRDRLPTTLSPR